MNNKNIILLLALSVVAAGSYFLFTNSKSSGNTENISIENKIEYYEDGKPIVYCDENGNRYNTEAEAKAAGLTDAQYGATYCPEYLASKTVEYRGLSVLDAEALAQAEGDSFRSVIIDGEAQAITRDFQEGRINATVEGGIVTDYFAESTNPPTQEESIINFGAHDSIMGMTVAEAEAYAMTNKVDFRTGSIDGEGMAVTSDFRPGRITVQVNDGVVVGYAVE
jgi:hypothetical protein